MRALTISAHGGLDRLELRADLPVPELRAPTAVRIRVRAAALNHLDLFVVSGVPGVTTTPPWPRFRLLGEHAPGTLAEYVVVPAANVRTIPASVLAATAAAFPLVTLT